MGFDIGDAVGRHLSVLPSLDEQARLGLGVGGGERAGLAAVIDSAPLDDCVNPVVVLNGPVKPLKEHQGSPFTTHVAIGPGVKGVAGCILREHARLVVGQGMRSVANQVDAADQRLITGAVPQGPDCRMHRHQGAGTGSVDHHAGSLEVIKVGEPVRQNRTAGACRGQGLHGQILGLQQPMIVKVAGADEHAGFAAAQHRGFVAGILHDLPAKL